MASLIFEQHLKTTQPYCHFHLFPGRPATSNVSLPRKIVRNTIFRVVADDVERISHLIQSLALVGVTE
jgi:hypothetical protein